MPQPYSNQQRQQFRYNTSRESGKYPASFYYPPGSPPPQRQLGGGDVQPSALSNQQLQQRQQYRDPADVYYPAGGSTAGGGSQRPQPYSDQQPQQHRDPADAYYPPGSAPVQSDMGNAYGYNTSRNDVNLSNMARAAATGGLSGHVARQLVGLRPSALSNGVSLSDMARAAATGGLSGHVARQLVGQPQPYGMDAQGTMGSGYNQSPGLLDNTPGFQYGTAYARQSVSDNSRPPMPNMPGYAGPQSAVMPSPLAPSGGWLSRAQESLSKYYGMGRDFLSNIQSPEHQGRLLDYTTATPERLTQFGQNYARSLGEVTPESQAKYDEMLEPMRGALSLQSDLNEGRNRSTAEQADRLQREARGMTPEEIEQGNQEMYDENGNIRGTEPSIRGRLHDQDMADARDIYEGSSENIPYDQSIMNRAAEGANRQENQDFAAGKPGFADRFRNLPPAEDENTIRMRRQDRTSPLDPRGEYFTARRRPLKERQQKMEQAGWTEDGERIEGSASAERNAGRQKVRVSRVTGMPLDFGDAGYEDGVDVRQATLDDIASGKKPLDFIRKIIKQEDRVKAYRKRQGGMPSALKTRLENKDRAFKRNMRGKPIYNKKGKMIGRRAPTATDDMRVDSISRMTGGMDWLAGAGRSTGMALDFDEPAPLRPEPSLAGASWALAGDRPTNKFIQATAQDRLRMNQGKTEFDKYSKNIIDSFDIGEVTTYDSLLGALVDNKFNEYTDSIGEDSHKAHLAVIRRIQHMHAALGRSAGQEDQVKYVESLGNLDRSDPVATWAWLQGLMQVYTPSA